MFAGHQQLVWIHFASGGWISRNGSNQEEPMAPLGGFIFRLLSLIGRLRITTRFSWRQPLLIRMRQSPITLRAFWTFLCHRFAIAFLFLYFFVSKKKKKSIRIYANLFVLHFDSMQNVVKRKIFWVRRSKYNINNPAESYFFIRRWNEIAYFSIKTNQQNDRKIPFRFSSLCQNENYYFFTN